MKFKIIKIILLVFVVLIIAVLAFGPMIAVNQLEKNSKEWVGRKLTIGDFSLNYFTGTVEVDGFVMFEVDDKTPFVAFDTLFINTEPYHLFSNELVVEEVGLSGLRTYVTHRDSIFNFDDLIAFYTKKSDSLETEEEPIDTNIEEGKLFSTEKGKNYKSNEDEFALFLREKTMPIDANKNDSIIVSYSSRKLVGKHILDSLYTNYSAKRILKIEEYLHQQNDSTQIGIQSYNASSPKNVGSIPIV